MQRGAERRKIEKMLSFDVKPCECRKTRPFSTFLSPFR